MSTVNDDMEGAHPKFDPSKILGKIDSLIQSKSSSMDDAYTPARVGVSWIWSMLVPALVLVAIAVAAWLSRSSSRELAKLRHERFKAKLDKERFELFALLNKQSSMVEQAKELLAASKDSLRIIEADISAEDKRHEANSRALHSIRTWDGSYPRMGG